MKTGIPIITVCFLALTALSAPPSTLEILQDSRKMYEKALYRLNAECSAWQQKAAAQYRVGLRRALATAQNAADFDGTRAIMDEEKRFIAENTIPESPPAGLAPAVVKVQEEYHSALREAVTTRDQKTVELTRRYLTTLEGLMRRLLLQKKMAEAPPVDEEIKRAKEKIAAIEAAKTPKPTVTQPAPPPPAGVP